MGSYTDTDSKVLCSFLRELWKRLEPFRFETSPIASFECLELALVSETGHQKTTAGVFHPAMSPVIGLIQRFYRDRRGIKV